MNDKEILIPVDKLKKAIELEREVRNKKNVNVKNFSWVLFFGGGEYNSLANSEELNGYTKTVIDFEGKEIEGGDFVKTKIKEIKGDENYPIIWFKNLDKIKTGSALENSLLPIFDPQQNTNLLDEGIDLSKFILIATSSTNDMGQLSPPLTSRLDCVNVGETKPRQFFLDKYFGIILIISITLTVVLGWINFGLAKEKEVETEQEKEN